MMFLVVLINIFLLVHPNASSSLFPPRNVYICPQESQEVQFVCNTTGEHVTWDINVNAVHHHVSFGYYSPIHQNKYNGFDGIEVTLEGVSGNTLLTRTVVRIPPFNITSHRLVVHCDYMARSLLVADVPASPFNLTVAHNTTESSNSKLLNTTLTWDFLSNGGYWRYTELYYNVSVYPSNGTTAQTHFLITSRREAPLVLSQNISYNISIVAVNCEGQSTKAEISFAFFPHSVKESNIVQVWSCVSPEVPANGSVWNVTGTSINSTLIYRCDEGFLPQLSIAFHCNTSGHWEPDPSLHVCTAITNTESNIVQVWSCVSPEVPANGSVWNVTGTSINSTLIYRCDEGYLPQLSIASHCNTSGHWEPDPSLHVCTAITNTEAKDEEEIKEPLYESFIFLVLMIAAGLVIAAFVLLAAVLLFVSCFIKYRKTKHMSTVVRSSNPLSNLQLSEYKEVNDKCNDSKLHSGLIFNDDTVNNHHYHTALSCDETTNVYETIQ